MESTQFIDIANNVSSILLLIIAVYWFNKKLEKAEIKSDELNDKVFELEKMFLTTIEKNTQAFDKMTDMLEDLKDEIKYSNENEKPK